MEEWNFLDCQNLYPALEQVLAKAFHDILKSWDLKDKITEMVFDTIEVNTGAKNGACILIEYKVKK